MKHNAKIIWVSLAFLIIAIACFMLMSAKTSDYITVTEDRGNICTYADNGKPQGASAAASQDVKLRIPKADYEQYKQDAIASNKCFR